MRDRDPRVRAAALLLAATVTAGAPFAFGQDGAVPGQQKPTYRPLMAFGEHLDGTTLKNPLGIFYDRFQDEVFVADTANGLIGIYDGAGVPKFTFSVATAGGSPLAVATDGEGRIHVLDASSRSIRIFSFRGDPEGEIRLEEIDRIKVQASGMTIGPDGRIYVVDSVGGRIIIYRPDGSLDRVIRGAGKGTSRLQNPFDLAVDGEGRIYVTDRRGTPVQVYGADGNFLRGWGKRDVGPMDFSTPAGIAVDGSGSVIVADPVRQDVKVFDPNGAFLAGFGGFGTGAGQVAYPTDVAAGPSGRLYVLERIGRRVQVFDRIPRIGAPSRAVHPAPPSPDPTNPNAPQTPGP